MQWACACTSKDLNSSFLPFWHWDKILTKPKSWQTNWSYSYSNNIPPKKFSQKTSKKISPKNIPPKNFLQKKILTKNPHKNFKKITKNSQDFESIKTPTYIALGGPSGLVFSAALPKTGQNWKLILEIRLKIPLSTNLSMRLFLSYKVVIVKLPL